MFKAKIIVFDACVYTGNKQDGTPWVALKCKVADGVKAHAFLFPKDLDSAREVFKNPFAIGSTVEIEGEVTTNALFEACTIQFGKVKVVSEGLGEARLVRKGEAELKAKPTGEQVVTIS